MAFQADSVQFDARSKDLQALGHVRVDEPPFHLTSPGLRLRRAVVGAELVGTGRLSLSSCSDVPLAVRFSAATVAPPHDVVLRNPVLEVAGIPLAWSPSIWLRSGARAGLLPPEIAWRGQDGLYVGAGVHVPWTAGDPERGVDLRAGVYTAGGAFAGLTLRTAISSTRVGWDRLAESDGLFVRSDGSTAIARPSDPAVVAWRLDALRGPRAVVATSDLAQAAEPFDRGLAEAAWRIGDWTLASGVRTVALRGSALADVGTGGPIALVRRSGTLGVANEYDVTAEAGQLAGGAPGPSNFLRGQGNFSLASHLGPMGAGLAVRGAGQVAAGADASGADGAAQVRGVLELPLAKSFGDGSNSAPWVHTTSPRVEVAVGETGSQGAALGLPPRGVLPNGGAWVATLAWRNRLDRLGAPTSMDIDAVLGEVGTVSNDWAEMRVRASVRGPIAELETDFAQVLAHAGGSSGGAWISHGRLGSLSGLYVAAHVAERTGADPILARALSDPALDPAVGFLAWPGWTGGATAALPLGSRATARAGADADLDTKTLVGESGSIELHDSCRCLAVRATVSHRVGRGGVDAWLAVDFSASSP
jgi:hypothetical protein